VERPVKAVMLALTLALVAVEVDITVDMVEQVGVVLL
jgi:hypothetical protein